MPNRNTIIVISIIVVSLLVALAWYQYNEPKPTPAQDIVTPVEIPPMPEPISEPEETPALELEVEEEQPEVPIVTAPPMIDNSDPQVLLAIADFAPKLSQWLIPNEQLRKWVLAIDLMADGKIPKRYLPVDYPMDKFLAEENGEQSFTSTDNFIRMNLIVNTIVEIEPAVLARYYKEWLPTLEKAYREQGKPDNFDQRFKQTVSRVITADIVEDKKELIRPGVFYQYADQKFEQASDVEKLLWRMGPENTETIQSYLRDLRNEIEGQ
jgi:hypothetical protein